MAHATLVGDDVTITLLGADSGNNAQSPGVTATVQGAAIEPDFQWDDAQCAFDDGVLVDIEDSTITVQWGGNIGASVVCNSNGDILDQPFNFTITSLDWVDFPNAIITGITVTDNQGAFPVTAKVLDDHSVEITAGVENSQFGTVVYTLEKSVILVEKTWTHTDYNWDPICDGLVNATDFCVDNLTDNNDIGFRPANINATAFPTDEVLADPLPLDGNGNYTAFAQVHRNDKFSNTNPGAFYALTTVITTASLSSITVWENYDDCTNDGNGILKFVSKKITRNVKVAIADPNGNVTELTDDLYDGVGGNIVATIDSAHVLIDQEIPADSTIFVLVKFNDNLKGVDAPGGNFDEMCHNDEEVVPNIGGVLPLVLAEADLRITNQP